MSLFDECIEAFNGFVQVVSGEKRELIAKEFERCFPISEWGRIEWERASAYSTVTTFEEIRSFLNQRKHPYNENIYVIWDEQTLPILQSTLDHVFKVIDDVTAVSFDTWIFSPSSQYVIEILHDGEVRVGIGDFDIL